MNDNILIVNQILNILTSYAREQIPQDKVK